MIHKYSQFEGQLVIVGTHSQILSGIIEKFVMRVNLLKSFAKTCNNNKKTGLEFKQLITYKLNVLVTKLFSNYNIHFTRKL